MNARGDTSAAASHGEVVAAAPAYRFSVDLLRAAIAPKASDGELLMFSRVCAVFQLSPFADQIVLIPRWDRALERNVHRHQITVAGRRVLASRTGELVGIDGPVWSGPRDDRGELHWTDLWDRDDAPYAARCLVYRKGWIKAANGTAKWSEFAQYGGKPPKLLPTWETMPSHMLGKVAESMALRRAFPEAIEPALQADANIDDDLVHVTSPDDRDPDLVELEDARADEIDVPVGDQNSAHRAVAALPDADKARWLSDHGITDFGSVWPDDAVRDAVELPFQ